MILLSDSLSSKQWWSLLKSFISPNSQSSTPPLEKDGLVYSDEKENGPDGVSNQIWSAVSNGLSSPICGLLNQSLRQDDVPECFK